jgi:hypothetical protein
LRYEKSVLEPGLKDFCFKLLYGRLYLNLALSHFSEVSAWCAFCTIRKKRELRGRGIITGTIHYERELEQIEPETIEHLLWSCREVNSVIVSYKNELAWTNGEPLDVTKYWQGCELVHKTDCMMSMLIVRFIQFSIYRCRKRMKLLLIANMREDVREYLRQLGRRAKWGNSIQRIPMICQDMLV